MVAIDGRLVPVARGPDYPLLAVVALDLDFAVNRLPVGRGKDTVSVAG